MNMINTLRIVSEFTYKTDAPFSSPTFLTEQPTRTWPL
jgi:hypothetical protein